MATVTTLAGDLLAVVARARVRVGEIALWYTGGAGYIVKTAGATFLIDPFVGPSNPPDWIRAIPPAFDPERLTAIDAVVLTHEHGDHADPNALGPLGRRTAAVVVGPAACVAVAEAAGVPAARCRVLAHDEALDVGDLHLTAVAMHDPGATLPNGYVLQAGEVTILHCGDGLYFPGFVDLAQRWRFDAICVSVGTNPPGKGYYMDEADAARAARDAGAPILIPHHHDLWQGITLDPRRVAVVTRWYSPGTRVIAARLGRRITVPRIGERQPQ